MCNKAINRPTKAELDQLLGKKVTITLRGGETLHGTLDFVPEFSEKYGYRKPNYYFIKMRDYAFKASHIKKVEVC